MIYFNGKTTENAFKNYFNQINTKNDIKMIMKIFEIWFLIENI